MLSTCPVVPAIVIQPPTETEICVEEIKGERDGGKTEKTIFPSFLRIGLNQTINKKGQHTIFVKI